MIIFIIKPEAPGAARAVPPVKYAMSAMTMIITIRMITKVIVMPKIIPGKNA
jgi:hypothetical protein